MHALVTGGAGFIGLSLARALHADGCAVDLLDDFSRGREDADLARFVKQPGVRCLKMDLSRDGAAEQIGTDYDAIFHFAAILGVANVISRAYETLVRNVQLTIEVLRIAKRQEHLSCFTFASTSEIYAGTLRAGQLAFPSPEDALLALPPLDEPRTSYMLSKLYGEALVLQSGVPGVIVRPHNVYGPRMGMAHVVPELMRRMRAARAGETVAIYSAGHSRTFCFIDDAVELIRRLASHPGAIGQAWNVGREAPECRIIELAELVREVTGTSALLAPAEVTQGSPSRRCPSMAKTRALTGYDAQISLRDGLQRTFDWYSRAGLLPAPCDHVG